MGEAIEGGMLEPQGFDFHWADIERELDKHPEVWADYYTKESLYSDVMTGRIQVWAFCEDKAIKLIVFTRIVDYPARRAFQVLLMLGNSLRRLLPLIEAMLERFARHEGCTMCEIIGRDGWAKLLGPRFKKQYVVLTYVDDSVPRVH